jgi:dienelactone hydrolase
MRPRAFFILFVLSACGQHASSMPPPPVEAPAIHYLDAKGQEVTSVYYLDPVVVRLTGLPPGAAVTITAEMTPWKSEVTFTAAGDGTVDTGRDAPTSGSYPGVDADGLFWSMNTPTFDYAKSTDVVFTVKNSTSSILTSTLSRPYSVPGAKQVAVDDPKLVGTLLLPPGNGPFAAMLAFGGSEGGLSGGTLYADELVPLGYAVLAVAYFGAPGVPADLKDIPLEYLDRALDWLEQRPEVDKRRVGVIGGSRGGELALLIAARRPELKAAIADAPSSYAWGAVAGDGAAWTVGGAPVPYVPSRAVAGTAVVTPDGMDAIAYTPMFVSDVTMASAAELEAARIKVEASGASVALYGGADDQLWPSCQFIRTAMDRLAASGHTASHADQSTCFADTGHLVNGVGLPTTWLAFSPDPVGQGIIALGGTPAGSAHAGRARQQKVRDFLAQVLAPL